MGNLCAQSVLNVGVEMMLQFLQFALMLLQVSSILYFRKNFALFLAGPAPVASAGDVIVGQCEFTCFLL